MSEHDPISSVVFWGTLIFSLAIAGRYLAKRFNQPGVLGELLMGVLFGNLCYFAGMQIMVVLREGPAIFAIMRDLLSGVSLNQAVLTTIPNPHYAKQVVVALSSSEGIDFIKIGYALDAFSRYGLIFLLFLVGLENSFQDLKHTGRESLQVAVLGVIAPILLGFLAVYLLLPDLSYKAHLFIAATLSATSIGITARVLRELKKLKTREARTILGAAMIDDILGLIILAVVSGIVVNNQINTWMFLQIVLSSILFFAICLTFGPWVLKKILGCLSFLSPNESKLVTGFIFLMGLSWLATLFQLASIIGAFTAGLLIHDGLFDESEAKNPSQQKRSIGELVAPFELIFTPLFFMLIGIQVKLESFFSLQVIAISIALIVAAILGKLISGIGANAKDDRFLIGLGMVPRGEVGLIFASVGRTVGVISDQLFSAIILMVIVTTLIGPLALKVRFLRHDKR